MGRVALIGGAILAGCFEPPGECDSETCRDGSVDAGYVDAGTRDAGTRDAGSSDAGSFDAGSFDAGSFDAGSFDAGSFDAGSFDAGSFDAGSFDAGLLDGGSIDGGSADAGQLRGRLWMLAHIGPRPGATHLGVYVQSPIGSATQLFSAPGRDVSFMAVSDDGAMIAISYKSPAELYVGPTDGGPAQLVRTAPGWINVYSISPDKRHVAFSEGEQSEDGALILPLDGGPAIQASPRLSNFIHPQYVANAEFSPDSRYFAFRFAGQTFVTDTLTGILSAVSVPSTYLRDFAWTSDTSYLLVTETSPWSLHLCEAPNTCAPLAGFAYTRTLNVSRDRTFAVVGIESADAGSSYDFFRVPLDGGPRSQMTTDLPVNSFSLRGLSPDGERFVVWSEPPANTLYAMPTTGTSQPSPLSTAGAVRLGFDLDSTQLFFLSSLGSNAVELHRIGLAAPGQSPVLQQGVDGGIFWEFVVTP